MVHHVILSSWFALLAGAHGFRSVEEKNDLERIAKTADLSHAHRRMQGMLDEFGIQNLYASASASNISDWVSDWSGGIRSLASAGRHDPADNQAFMKGRGSIELGSGVCTMRNSPRLYIAALPGQSGWGNVEMTAYGRYLSDGEIKSYSGLTMVARTNHGDFARGCTAPGYYARIYRRTGEAGLQKEYYHGTTGGAIYSASRRVQIPGFEAGLPPGRWVGMKFAVYTDSRGVHLELFIDLSGGSFGGNWTLVTSFLDTPGAWMSTRPVPEECASFSPPVIDGGLVLGSRSYCFLRADGDGSTEVQWANASIRRIRAGTIASEVELDSSFAQSFARTNLISSLAVLALSLVLIALTGSL